MGRGPVLRGGASSSSRGIGRAERADGGATLPRACRSGHGRYGFTASSAVLVAGRPPETVMVIVYVALESLTDLVDRL